MATAAPSELDRSVTPGSLTSWSDHSALELVGRGGHVDGVEGAGDLERDDAGLGRRVGREGGELLEGAGGDDLAGAVHVGRGEAVPVEGGGHLGGVAAEDRATCRSG